jgi:hypothetical protein
LLPALQCVGLSEPQHEHLLRHVLEQQQDMLAIQQRALLDSNSGAGGQQHAQAPQLQLRRMPQQQQQQQQQRAGWGAVDALELPDEYNSAAGPGAGADEFLEAHARTGSWVAQHNNQQQQMQELLDEDQGDEAAGAYPFAAELGGSFRHHDFDGGSQQDFDGPLAARLPAGAIVSSSPATMTPANGGGAPSTAVFKWMGDDGMTVEDRAAVAAAAAYAAVPDPVKPAAQGSTAYGHGSYTTSSSNAAGRQRDVVGGGQKQSSVPQTVQELAGALAAPAYPEKQQQQQQQHNPAAAQPGSEGRSRKQVLPGIEEIESVLAAYSAAGVFPAGDAGAAQSKQPLLHFMLAPQNAAAGDAAAALGGAVLCRAPPQVTAVAQVCG